MMSKLQIYYNLITFSFDRQVLEELEILEPFTAVLHIPKISSCEQLVVVLRETDAFSEQQIAMLHRKIGQRRYVKRFFPKF